MRYLILFSVLWLPIVSVHAYNPVSAEPTEAYSVIPIEGDPYVERTYLGDLEDAPDMYELKTDVAITLRVQLQQRAGKRAVPFGLMIVRQNDEDGGVKEIERQNISLESWTEERSYTLGIKFLTAPVLQKEILPGTYRIEVSTPDNKGAYALTIGEEPNSYNFFSMFGHVIKTQYHFGLWPFHLLLSAYFFLVFVVLGAGSWWYWFKVHKAQHHGNDT